MHARLERVKTHVQSNKTAYIVGGTCLVVGALGTMVVNRTGVQLAISNPGIINWRPSAMNLQINITRPGPKAFVIQCAETQEIWPSLRQAAKDLGHNPGTLSAHLKGKIPDVGGLHLEKVGEV